MKNSERKSFPVWRGLMAYFPLAMLGVARCSKVANDQHNPGEPMHWAREKSTGHQDCAMRHWLDVEMGTRVRAWAEGDDRQKGEPTGPMLPPGIDSDGIPHVDKAAWRANAVSQEWHEKNDGPKEPEREEFDPKVRLPEEAMLVEALYVTCDIWLAEGWAEYAYNTRRDSSDMSVGVSKWRYLNGH